MTGTKKKYFTALTAALLLVAFCQGIHAQGTRQDIERQSHVKLVLDWPAYGGQVAGDHYSGLSQINRKNVGKLQVAWTFDAKQQGGLETSPIVVGRVLYAYTAKQDVIALDGASGRLIWKFESGVKGTQPVRGLAYWTDGEESRILASVQNFLYALDARTGKPIAQFGENGRIDLRKDLRGDYQLQSIAMTSPGIVYKDLIIVGGRNPETHPSPPGDIRAFSIRTGALRWRFHTLPHPGEFGYDTWPKDAWTTAGAANNWAGMALDAKHGIVYVPTGSPVFDFYGADRVGDGLFGDTLLALDAGTGKRIWHFQGVHHDIWDRDFPSPPALLSVMRNGKPIDAVAQTTKQGDLFLFDRLTGKPLFPIQERKYPASDVPGEVASPTQPRPILPEPFARQILTREMLTERTPAAHAWAVKEFETYRSQGQYVPIGLDKETIVFPCFLGGAEWGGPAVDVGRGVIFVNSNDVACTVALTKNKPGKSVGGRVYHNQCSICHGENRSGSPPNYPSLVDIGKHLSESQIQDTILEGKGRMPSFPNLRGSSLEALMRSLTGKELPGKPDPDEGAIYSSDVEGAPLPYQITGSNDFLDPDGYPAVAPPWGTLNAIDLNTGKYLWKIPFGEYPELVAKGMASTGSENYGGPIVTAGDLLFIGATVYDKKFRAFDSRTGQLLWQTTLPFAGVATPATYMIDGKQYVVIAAGGGKDLKAPSGSVYVAFALP